jgi:hypothetical protein
MAEAFARWLLEIAAIYGMVGLAFAIPFATGWVGRLDASARAGSWGFRILIVPGVVALWPVLVGKVWRVRRGRYVPPVAERPVSPARLRRIHGWSFRTLAVLVPLVCAAALITRPPAAPVSPDVNPVRIFSRSLPLREPQVSGLPIKIELRTEGTDLEAVLQVTQALSGPVVALYWSSTMVDAGIPRDAVFLGSVWGPADLPMVLPREAAVNHGVLYFLSLSGEQRVLAVFPLKTS